MWSQVNRAYDKASRYLELRGLGELINSDLQAADIAALSVLHSYGLVDNLSQLWSCAARNGAIPLLEWVIRTSGIPPVEHDMCIGYKYAIDKDQPDLLRWMWAHAPAMPIRWIQLQYQMGRTDKYSQEMQAMCKSMLLAALEAQSLEVVARAVKGNVPERLMRR